MKLLLCYCVDKKYFTIDELNGRMERYDFEDNKPRPFDPSLIHKADSKIRQSASQMMVLSQQLPLIIADKIPFDDPPRNHFLLLFKICKIVNSPVCTPDTVAYLSILIEEKLQSFNTVYPHARMLPKHHYMVHYSS